MSRSLLSGLDPAYLAAKARLAAGKTAGRPLPKRQYGRTREKLRKQLGLLISNPRHPSLGIKKIKGTRSIFEARVDDHYRFTFEFGERNEIILRVIGAHNSALKKP